jgi:signal transduction histidine kinase
METMPDGFFSLNNPNFLDIMLRFVINLVFLYIIIRVIYFRYSRKEELLFTFFLMGIMVFIINSMLRAVMFDIGFAFGLFAIFAILRFRTNSVSLKDMAYIFTVIGISMMNSLKVFKFPMFGIFIFNFLIILSAYVLEEYLVRNKTDSHIITFENLELLKPEKEQKLLKELSLMTGKSVFRTKIQRVDYKRGLAILEIFYKG